MKILTLLLFILIFPCVCFCQRDSIVYSKNGKDSILLRLKGKQILETLLYYKSGQIQSDYFFADDGDPVKIVSYYENGKIASLYRRHKKYYTWNKEGKRTRSYLPEF